MCSTSSTSPGATGSGSGRDVAQPGRQRLLLPSRSLPHFSGRSLRRSPTDQHSARPCCQLGLVLSEEVSCSQLPPASQPRPTEG